MPATEAPNRCSAPSRSNSPNSAGAEPGRYRAHPSPTIEERAIATAISLKQTTKRPGVARHDTVAAAARKTLRFHFSRVLKHEAGTIDGSDIEELHDMRVAVRRLRAAVQLFRPYLPQQDAAYLRKELRRLGRALGPVRDYDVMLENLAAYRAAAPVHARAEFAPLVQRWHKQRARARKDMLGYLAGKRYRLLKQRIEPIVAGDPRRRRRACRETGSSLKEWSHRDRS